MARRDSSSRPEDRRRSRQRQADASGRNQHRKKRSRDQRPDTGATEESRGDSSQGLSTEALAQLERRNQREKRKAERTRRASRGANYHEVEQSSPRRERERDRGDDREQRRERGRERPKEKEKHAGKDKKKRRVVSGAVMEEGRARGGGLRGGRGEQNRWSEQSLDKEDYYHKPKAKKGKKKKCMCVHAS